LFGATLASLIATYGEWVHRRKDSSKFIDATTVRRHLEIEFTPPPAFQNLPPDPPRVIPLTLLSKQGVILRAVTNESGVQLPSVTSGEAARLAQEMLRACAPPDRQDDDLVELLIRNIIASPDGSALSEAKRRDSPTLRALLGVPRFADLAETLSTAIPLFVVLDDGAGRRIVEVEFEMSALSTWSAVGRLVELFGWRETVVSLDVPSANLASPYEFEVEAPEDLEFTDANLVIGKDGSQTTVPEVTKSVSSKFVRLGISDPMTKVGSSSASISMKVERAYSLWVFATSVFVAVVTTLTFFRLTQVESRPEAAVVLLLAVPTLFAASVAFPLRKTPASQLISGARRILLASALAIYAATMTLILIPPNSNSQSVHVPATLKLAWFAALIATWTLVAVQSFSLFGPLLQGHERRP
jgi:hypothetical protein